MRFSKRLGLSVGIALGVLIIALLFSLFGLHQAKQRTEQFLHVDQVLSEQENLIYSQGLQTAQALRNIVMNPKNKMAREQWKLSGEIIENASLKLRELAVHEPETVAMVDTLRQLRARQLVVQQEIVNNAEQLDWAVEKIAKEETPIWRDIRLLITKSIEERRQKMHQAETELAEFMGRTLVISAVIGSAGVLIGVVLLLLLGRSILRQLGGDPADAERVASLIAQGNFSHPVPVRSNDTSSLMYSMSQMQSSLIQTVRQVQQSAEAIDVAANEIRLGNTDLSARTEAQAAGLEQTAAAMEQITSTVRLNADNAVEGNRAATEAAKIASQSSSAVSSAVSTMNDISESSARIVDIIAVIDSIAFQTNILALNAAVEAARAGEQGRGFAVVASEVRTLAQRSASAAADIKQLIDNSVERIKVGNNQISAAGSSVNGLMETIEGVATIMDEITNASQEQSVGIGEIGQAVRQLDDTTQQNAALVQEASAAAQSLAEQSARLKQMMAEYKVPMPSSEILISAPEQSRLYGTQYRDRLQ